ncbi:MAG: hypothetical protein QF678_05495 [Candidatus Poseidoniia archaeon]|nr:hypothetical protein [Candidatus Poseidoniia archaeon]
MMPPEYSVAARQALATMAAGLLFLVILPLGIPLALVVAPFLAGRAGAQQLPRNWHAFFVLTVGFGWAVALLLALLLGLSRLAGPSFALGTIEPILLLLMLAAVTGSFALGVRSAPGLGERVALDVAWDALEEEQRAAVPETAETEETVPADSHPADGAALDSAAPGGKPQRDVAGLLARWFKGGKRKAAEAVDDAAGDAGAGGEGDDEPDGEADADEPPEGKSARKGDRVSRVGALARRRRRD